MKRSTLCAVVAGLLGALLMATGDAGAATFYVDQSHPSANDGNAGTDENLPWRTLHRAVTGIPAREAGSTGDTRTFNSAQLPGPGDTVFVKNGRYEDVTAPAANGASLEVKYNPVRSGINTTPAGMIAYRAFPGHAPVVARVLANFGSQAENSPVIGANGRSFIAWDGFTLDTGLAGVINNANGVMMENLLIDKGPPPAGVTVGLGNYSGIFIQLSINVTIRNNRFRNITYTNNTSSGNCHGIVMFDNANIYIHNNEFLNTNAGIDDKENGIGNLFEKNIFINNGSGGILFSGFTTARCGTWPTGTPDPTCPVGNTDIRHNIFVNSARGVNLNLGNPAVHGNIRVYNNVFHNVDSGIRVVSRLPGLQFYNNIITINNGGNNPHHFIFGGNLQTPSVPVDLLADFNDFRATSGSQARFRPLEFGGSAEDLNTWRLRTGLNGRGLDGNSRTVDPQFQGPTTGIPAPTAFRLQVTSELRNAGCTGGGTVLPCPAGSQVHVGAYLTDDEVNEVIGPGATIDVLAPNPPISPRVATP